MNISFGFLGFDVAIWAAVVAVACVAALKIFRGNPIKKALPKANPSGYNLFYSDQKNDERIVGVIYSALLSSERFGLTGKPDYIFIKRNGRDFCPVELKSASIGDASAPYEKDLMQLTAYFLIIEDIYGIRPKYGRLVYKDFMFIIKNSHTLRTRLFSILDEMNNMLKTGVQNVSPGFAKCRGCICRETVCEFAGSNCK